MVELEAKAESLEAALASSPPPSVVLPDDLAAALEGDLVALLSLGTNAAKAGAAGAAGLREQVRSVMVVAGAGFEPAAFRL